MTTAAPLAFDTADHAPDSGTRTTLAATALALMAIEAQIAALRASAEPLRRELLARMEATGTRSVVVAGAGSVSYVAGSTRTTLDSKAAQAALEALGVPVPLAPSTVKASLRLALNK